METNTTVVSVETKTKIAELFKMAAEGRKLAERLGTINGELIQYGLDPIKLNVASVENSTRLELTEDNIRTFIGAHNRKRGDFNKAFSGGGIKVGEFLDKMTGKGKGQLTVKKDGIATVYTVNK